VSNCMCDHRNPERGPVFQFGTYKKNDDSSTPQTFSSVKFFTLKFLCISSESAILHSRTCVYFFPRNIWTDIRETDRQHVTLRVSIDHYRHHMPVGIPLESTCVIDEITS
jgi:hypothetical protein